MMKRAVGALLVLASFVWLSVAEAGEVVWLGSETDSNWSTASNWEGGTLPASTDSAVFNGTSGRSCTVDVDVTVGALHIADEYEGVVNFSSSRLTLTTGDLVTSQLNDGHFRKGTSTVRFTGGADQTVVYRDRYHFATLENAKSGGMLRFVSHDGGQWNVMIDRFVGRAGSTTRFPWMTTSVADLQLLGEAGNEVRVVHGLFLLKGTQTVRYAYLEDVNCAFHTYSEPLIATDHCTDGGKNEGVYFDGVYVWEGDVDGLWSTAGNWHTSTVPQTGSTVVFGFGVEADCELDTDVDLAELLVYENYQGTLALGTHTVGVDGRLNVNDDAYTQVAASQATVELEGDDLLRVQCPNGQRFGTVAVNAARARFLHGFQADALTVAPGCEVEFAATDPADPHASKQVVKLNTLQATGTAAAPIVFTPVFDLYDRGYPKAPTYGVWHLQVTGSQAVAHVQVLGCDASAGLAIDGTTGCVDRGRNVNWTFADYAWIKLPSESAVSPLCVEGWRQGDASSAIALSNGTTSTPVTWAGANLWYADTALADGAVTPVTVTADGSTLLAQDVTWTATDVNGLDAADDRVVLRPSDSLRLWCSGSGTVEVDDGLGGGYVTVTAPQATTYAATGGYTVRVRLDGTEVGSLRVQVVDVDLAANDPLAVQIDRTRRKQVDVIGGKDRDVRFTGANQDEIEVTRFEKKGRSYVDFRLRPHARGDFYLLARAGSASGPILRAQQLHTFTLEYSTYEYHPLLKTFADGDALVGGTVKMTPVYPDLKIQMHIATAGALFEDTGTIDRWLRTNDFDPNGQINYYIISSASTVACHSTGVAMDDDE